MDLFTVIKDRRSCRSFLPDPVSDADIETIIGAAINAPSPLNSQPWSFVVVTAAATKEKICSEALRCRNFLFEKSGWKWLGRYDLEFLKNVPAMIAVVGDPKKSGADIFMEGGAGAWREACAAAVQTMLLAAQAIGLSTLWFTMFDKENIKQLLGIEGEAVPLSIIMVGKAAVPAPAMPRKSIGETVRYLR
ncbi:MAG: nitroreductase family protein [Chitinispirillaceae bacterium]|nr:nitroreductase family protein [Chitinispirillaceae bacterium]